MFLPIVNVASPINWASSLNRGLVFLSRYFPAISATPATHRNHVGRTYGTINGSGLGVGSCRWLTGSMSLTNTAGASSESYGTYLDSFVSTALTISVIYRPTGLSGHQRMVAENNNAGTYPFTLGTLNANAQAYSTRIGNGTSLSGTSTLSVGETYHLAFTIGSVVGAALYVNGKQESTTTYNGSTLASGITLHIGSDYQTSLYGMNGALEECRIYNREMSAAEVNQLYLAAAKGHQSEYNWVRTSGNMVAPAAAAGGSSGNLLLLGCGA